jgi:hypothetical protein
MTVKRSCLAVAALVIAHLVAGCRAQPEVVTREAQGIGEAPALGLEVGPEAPVSETGGGPADGLTDKRQVILRASMTLVVRDSAATLRQVREYVETKRGFVESTDLRDSDAGPTGTMTLRVPQESLEAALEKLRSMASGPGEKVESEQQSREDVTRQVVDVDARLRNLRRAETQLLELLSEVRRSRARAEDVLQVYEAVVQKREQIETLQAQRDALSEQIALATIVLTIVPLPQAVPVGAEPWRPSVVASRALAALLGAIRGLGNVLIWLALLWIPLLVIAALPIVAIVALARRRRRKRAGSAT